MVSQNPWLFANRDATVLANSSFQEKTAYRLHSDFWLSCCQHPPLPSPAAMDGTGCTRSWLESRQPVGSRSRKPALKKYGLLEWKRKEYYLNRICNILLLMQITRVEKMFTGLSLLTNTGTVPTYLISFASKSRIQNSQRSYGINMNILQDVSIMFPEIRVADPYLLAGSGSVSGSIWRYLFDMKNLYITIDSWCVPIRVADPEPDLFGRIRIRKIFTGSGSYRF